VPGESIHILNKYYEEVIGLNHKLEEFNLNIAV